MDEIDEDFACCAGCETPFTCKQERFCVSDADGEFDDYDEDMAFVGALGLLP